MMPPLSLYIHVPWCRRKCPFCDLESRGLQGALPGQAYARAVVRDLCAQKAAVQGRSLCSVFFGGGTPGLLPVRELAGLLDATARHLSLAAAVEVTLELHPLDITPARMAACSAAGVNRVSIGVQSFDDAALAALSRPYSGAQVCAAVRCATEYFDRVNLDLMYGLPGQSLQVALQDLQCAQSLQPEHLSWYPLSLQPGTPFYRHPPPLPTEEVQVAMESEGSSYLAAQGYQRYEICAWSRPGAACRHNLNYWEFGDYLGLGAGAHGKQSVQPGHIVRERRLRHPARYMAAAGGDGVVEERCTPDAAEQVLEFMMNALRLCAGFRLQLFTERTGLPLLRLQAPLAEAVSRGLLVLRDGWAVPTRRGLDFHNDLVLVFAGSSSVST